MPSHQNPDGTWHHLFSATWLETYARCPEQGRQRYYKLNQEGPSDYIALGGAVHAGIEEGIRTILDADPCEGTNSDTVHHLYARSWDAALGKLFQVEGELGYHGDKWDHGQLVDLIRQHLTTFYDEVYPTLKPVAAEQTFERELHSDPFRTISIRGSIDYIDEDLGVIDWKTAGNPHKPWEKQRFAMQPTVYSWIAGADGMRYVVFVHNKKPQTYEVSRTEQHTEWMRFQALQAARLIESGLPVWTPNDQGWWCSAKWCPAWDNCKGMFIKEEER